MIYDVIIIWAWAAWLFAWINLPKKLNKLILEKNDKPWIKVLLSGWERANVSNIDIEPMRDYFGQNKKALLSVFNKYNQWDIQSFFAQSWINIVEEDRWRLILESWDSKELLSLLLKKSKESNCELKCSSEVIDIKPINNVFQIKTTFSTFEAKNVIVSSWGKSFFQVWTTWDSYKFAEKLWIKIIPPHRGLCGLVTKKDFSSLSWSSLNLNLKIKTPIPNSFPLQEKGEIKYKIIYEEKWPFLFTHYGISGPIVFNGSIAIWEYLNEKNIFLDIDKIEYMKNNIICEIEINPNASTKKINKFFNISSFEVKGSTWNVVEGDGFWDKIEFWLQDWRSWKEAKITGGWVDIDEMDNNMQVKKIPWLYFIWESVDITWKTGWFNLQWAWGSSYVCASSF